jgi:hypothetical protein
LASTLASLLEHHGHHVGSFVVIIRRIFSLVDIAFFLIGHRNGLKGCSGIIFGRCIGASGCEHTVEGEGSGIPLACYGMAEKSTSIEGTDES